MVAQMETQNLIDQKFALYALPDITRRGAFSKSHLYNLMARGHFPKPSIRSGSRFTRWNASEVDRWLADPQAYIDANTAAAT
jgi:predicted DNA-binding transcriptional regulator AlpA